MDSSKESSHNGKSDHKEGSFFSNLVLLFNLLFPKQEGAPPVDWERLKVFFKRWAKRAPYIAIGLILLMVYIYAHHSKSYILGCIVRSCFCFLTCLTGAFLAKKMKRSPLVFLFATPLIPIGSLLLIGFLSLVQQTGFIDRQKIAENEIQQKKQELVQQFARDKEDFKKRFSERNLGVVTEKASPVSSDSQADEKEEVSPAASKANYMQELEKEFQKKSEAHSAHISSLSDVMMENFKERTKIIDELFRDTCKEMEERHTAFRKKFEAEIAESVRKDRENWEKMLDERFEGMPNMRRAFSPKRFAEKEAALAKKTPADEISSEADPLVANEDSL